MESFPHIFRPISVGDLTLRNRIAKAPMFMAYAESGGEVSPAMIGYYADVARGGAGMVVVANGVVDGDAVVGVRSLRYDEDRFISGLNRLASTIRGQGAAAVAQLVHPGRFSTSLSRLAPSEVSFNDLNVGAFYKGVLRDMSLRGKIGFLSHFALPQLRRPKAMNRRDIRRVIADFANAAVRARQAGFDMIEIHGGTGYLPVQFLSPLTNRRRDEYGGSLENRMRFSLELMEAVRASVGMDFPVGCRFQADENIEGGFCIAEARIFARRLEEVGAAYLSVTGGRYEFLYASSGDESARPDLTGLAVQVRQEVGIPVIATGGVRVPEDAETLLSEEKADIVGLGRALFVDPEWVSKARKRPTDIRDCPAGCLDCFRAVLEGRPAWCPQWSDERKERMRDMLEG